MTSSFEGQEMTQKKRMRMRAWRMAGLALFVFVAAQAATAGASDPCSGVPKCVQEKQSTLKLKGLQTKGWAYYCVHGYPYFRNWSKSGYKGISVAENTIAEGSNPSKFDATFTNWDPDIFKTESVTITLGCSKISKGSKCTSLSSDPKCPIIRGPDNNCSQGPVSACIQTWTEKCSGGTEWNCTDDEGVTWCTC